MAVNIELHAKQHVFESVKVVKKQQAKCLLWEITATGVWV
jgi:hypothetical protein